jgi:hypothetical protein
VTSQPPVPPHARPVGGADLLRAVGLMADGPVTWGRPVPSGRPGVYVVEWPQARADAPIELTLVGKWLERLPGLRLDGHRPTTRALAARLHDFWLPGQAVVYVGMTTGSLGSRLASLYRTPLGDRRPYAGGHWLKTLRGLDRARVWWAETSAPEEYEDALLGAFGASIDASSEAVPRLPDRAVVLPFANLRTATGTAKAHGVTGAAEPRTEEPPLPETRIVEVPEGAADGADESQPRRPMEPRSSPARRADGAGAPAAVPAAALPGRPAVTGRAVRDDVAALNDALQEVACRRLLRELNVADAAAELSARGFLRGTRAQPAAVLRDLLKQGLIEGAVQDSDRRWEIRCVRGSPD